MKLRRASWTPDRPSPAVQRFLERGAFDPDIEAAARRVLDDVRREGERAVLRYARKFDGAALTARTLRVTEQERRAARAAVDPAFRAAARETHRRVLDFARRSMRADWSAPTAHGGLIGEQFRPIDRVGVYIPGGTAPLVSTCLMTVPLARAAGVREIVACTPAGRAGALNPYLLYALDLAGTDEVYKVGGMHAIALLAYGTRHVRKVRKIVGPGGAYVTMAKKCVYGDVALDLVAGPSEVAILADADADPRYIAADLLAQAEHGTGAEKALLVTPSALLLDAVEREVARQLATLSRRALIGKVIARGVLLARVRNLRDGLELCNRFAPEHLELLVRNPAAWRARVRHAGAIFCGEWTPEVVGDFAAGPSHVLPTGGAAAMFSGLSVDDFRTRSSVMQYTRDDLRDALPATDAFGRVEGLDAHARSARCRFEAV